MTIHQTTCYFSAQLFSHLIADAGESKLRNFVIRLMHQVIPFLSEASVKVYFHSLLTMPTVQDLFHAACLSQAKCMQHK